LAHYLAPILSQCGYKVDIMTVGSPVSYGEKSSLGDFFHCDHPIACWDLWPGLILKGFTSHSFSFYLTSAAILRR